MATYIGDDISAEVLEAIVRDAYATFRHPEVAPLVQIEDDLWIQELFHGPTLAFKDLALQVVGRLFDHVLAERSDRVTIIGATSGDTGSAAIDAVKSCDNVDIVILYPRGRTSDVQRRQMTTVDSPNVHAVAVDGTFDDCQDLVKAMFADEQLRRDCNLSAVNSINWARDGQIVYYVTASQAFAEPARFCVPPATSEMCSPVGLRNRLEPRSTISSSHRMQMTSSLASSTIVICQQPKLSRH